MIEEQIKNLKETFPDDKQVMQIWNRIEQSSIKNSFFHRVLNSQSYLYFSIIFFISCIIFTGIFVNQKKDIVLSNTNTDQDINVEFILKKSSNDHNTNHILVIYDEFNNTEVVSNYKIEDEKLRILLKPGIYRIVFSSENFESFAVNKFVSNNI